MIKIFQFSKSVHRILLLMVTTLGLEMMITGIILKYPNLVNFYELNTVRFIHSSLSIYFAAVLAAMIITGLLLYIIPLFRSKKADN